MIRDRNPINHIAKKHEFPEIVPLFSTGQLSNIETPFFHIREII